MATLTELLPSRGNGHPCIEPIGLDPSRSCRQMAYTSRILIEIPGVPVGYNIDERGSLVGGQYDMDTKDFPSVMHSLQSLDLGGGKRREPEELT